MLLSSHLMTEVEELCNRVAIVRSGRMVFEGAMAELKRTAGGSWRLRTTDDATRAAVCRAQRGIDAVHAEPRELRFEATEDAAAELSIALVEAGLGIRALAPHARDARGAVLPPDRGRGGARAADDRRRPGRRGGRADGLALPSSTAGSCESCVAQKRSYLGLVAAVSCR